MLRPFSRFCVHIGAIPESIIKSLSYEEQLLRLIKFLKCVVIPAIDGNTNAIKEIEEWINNVDLQDEVNNKLDDMAESGQLQEIISEYLNSKAIFGYDTVQDMKQATNLINGSYAKTLGYHSKNDGGSSLYKIRTITNSDIVDNGSIIPLNNTELVAELIITDYIRPEMFGAKRNSNEDSSNAFISMFNYLSLTKKDELYLTKAIYKTYQILLEGNYTITNDITTNLNNIEIIGNSVINIGSNKLIIPKCYNLKLDGIKFNGEYGKYCIYMDWYGDNDFNMSTLSIKNCQFYGSGIYLSGQSVNGLVENSQFYKCNIAVYNKCDSLEFNTCWFQPAYETTANKYYIIDEGSSIKFFNCFFIPNGTNIDNATNNAWIQTSGISSRVIIDSCRLSAEPGTMCLIAWNTPATDKPDNNSLVVTNCTHLAVEKVIIGEYAPTALCFNNNGISLDRCILFDDELTYYKPSRLYKTPQWNINNNYGRIKNEFISKEVILNIPLNTDVQPIVDLVDSSIKVPFPRMRAEVEQCFNTYAIVSVYGRTAGATTGLVEKYDLILKPYKTNSTTIGVFAQLYSSKSNASISDFTIEGIYDTTKDDFSINITTPSFSGTPTPKYSIKWIY